MGHPNNVTLPIPKNDDYTVGKFFEDVGHGILGALKGIAEPALIVMDFGQMGAALVTHAVSPEDYADVQFLSATGKRISRNPDEGWRAGLVVATVIPTGGASALADNIYTVFDQNMSPEEARRFLVRGAAGQVAGVGLGIGISKVSGSGFTGRGPSAARDVAMGEKIIEQRIADGNTNQGNPTYATGHGPSRPTTVRQSIPMPRPLKDVHAEPQVLADLPKWGGRTVVVDQVPCPACWVELSNAAKPAQPGFLKSSVTGSLRVLTIRKGSNPAGSAKSASLAAAKSVEGAGLKIPLYMNLEITVYFAPPITPGVIERP